MMNHLYGFNNSEAGSVHASYADQLQITDLIECVKSIFWKATFHNLQHLMQIIDDETETLDCERMKVGTEHSCG